MPSLLSFLFACSGADFDVSGTVDGSEFVAAQAYWGQSYILFIDREIECIDMWWVQKFNLDGDTPPTTTVMRALQVTYNNEEEQVYEGTYSVGGEAPIKTEFLDIQSDIFSVSRSNNGTLELDKKVDNKALSGALNFEFSDGQVSGVFDNIEWCVNIK